MTVSEAIKKTTGHGPGLTNRSSVEYTQSLIDKKENIQAAVTANVRTLKEHFPAVVVLTDHRLLIVHKLFNIRRVIAYPYEKLDVVTEKKSAIQHECIFHVGGFQFVISLNKRDGDAFIPCLKNLDCFIEQKEYRDQKYKK